MPKQIKDAIEKFKAQQSPVKVPEIDINSPDFLRLYKQKHEAELQVYRNQEQ